MSAVMAIGRWNERTCRSTRESERDGEKERVREIERKQVCEREMRSVGMEQTDSGG